MEIKTGTFVRCESIFGPEELWGVVINSPRKDYHSNLFLVRIIYPSNRYGQDERILPERIVALPDKTATRVIISLVKRLRFLEGRQNNCRRKSEQKVIDSLFE